MFEIIVNNDIPQVRSSLLQASGAVTHAFSTRLGGVSPFPQDSLNLGFHTTDQPAHVRQNRDRFAQALALPAETLACVRFVHGDDIVDIDAQTPLGTYLHPEADLVEADGLATNVPGIGLFVTYADCAPLLFFDPVGQSIAAVHAGWRGVAKGLPAKAVHHLVSHYGAQAQEILVAVGPLIGPREFEVGPEVRGAFKDQTANWQQLFQAGAGDRSYLDLATAISWQLQGAGVLADHIDLCPWSTAGRPELFFSYRRSGPDHFGVMGALIALV